MRKPYRKRTVNKPPRFSNFKPSGVPRRYLQSVTLSVDEFEAIRLADYEQLDQQEAAEKMEISRPTFARLIQKARQKVAQVLVDGKELIIEGGNVHFIYTIHQCEDCNELNVEPFSDEQAECPSCGSTNVVNLALPFLGRQGRRRHGRCGN